ncbi:GAF domain-containing sensor histidine kinase [Atribacter laminatus]|uniref:histidine kinase n=1 Tax=Atribacter laminatus TaxID=2847778 RepID=A0A7T1F4F1_ATRLM|nr:GAF domain-containing protein [Atribacter laminatus]QPM69451.1 Sensor histidine kinase LiaS [Atribacter laminatus]
MLTNAIHKKTIEFDLMDDLLQSALSLFQCQTGTIAVLDTSLNLLRIVAATGISERWNDSPFIDPKVGVSGYVLENRQMVIIDEKHDPPFDLKYQRFRDTCSICAPLIDNKKSVIGTISLNKQTGFFQEESIPYLQLMTKEIAIILEEIRLKNEREATIQMLNMVSSIFQGIHCTTNYEGASEAILQAAVTVTRAKKGMIIRPMLYTINISATYQWEEAAEFVRKNQKYLLKILRQTPISKNQFFIDYDNLAKLYFGKHFNLDSNQDFPIFICPIQPEGKPWGFLILVLEEKLHHISSLALEIVLKLAETTYQNIHLLQHNQHLTVQQERLHLARELHDGLTQSLIALRMQLEYFLSLEKTQDQQFLDRMHDTLDECVKDSRAILSRLRRGTKNEKSIRELIENKIKKLSWDTNQQIDFRYNLCEKNLSNNQKRFLIKLIHESIINACKHSSAKKIQVKVGHFRRGVYFIVRDNGKGFLLEKALNKKNSFGLKDLYERVKLIGGALRIQSAVGKGTIVKAVFPIHG